MTRLILTEKPSVAKDIAKVLKINTVKDGYYEGNGHLISWAFGHLIRLSDPPAYNPQFEKWSLDDLPIIPDAFLSEIQSDPRTQKQFQTIKTLLLKDEVKEVVCATDAGREGELIFRLIYEKAGCTKPILRLWISSQTDSAILEGFNQLKPGEAYNPLFDSARSRSEADWIIGINATRAYTGRFSRGQGVMSVGRVQTPVLKMIVDRYLANTQFNAQNYYEIEAKIVHKNGDFTGLMFATENDFRFFDKAVAEERYKQLEDTTQGSILSLSQKTVYEKPPLLYDLTELQKEANKKFKYSADETLSIMQKLYETHKILTYPRTSSRYLSADIKPKIPQLLKNLADLPAYSSLSQALSAEPLSFTTRMFDDKKVTDHHAIIPTDKKADLSQLSESERNIFDLVIKRFLAGFMDDCQKDQTEIISQFGTLNFRSFGSVMKATGWREAYGNEADEDQDEGQRLPVVAEKDPIICASSQMLEKKTKAPPLHNEASILAAMETAGKNVEDEEMRQAMKHCGLGTPATRAQILERLIKVQYITREKNRLIPTPKGIQLISYIQDKALLSPELTGDWELKLNNIVSNTFSRDVYMKEIKEFAHEIVNNVKTSTLQAIGTVKNPIGTCPLCGGVVGESKMAFGCSNWKNTGCTFKIWKVIAGKEISESMAKTLLTARVTKPIKGFKSKEGNAFVAGLKLDDKGQVVFDFQPENMEKIGDCPLCQAPVVERKMAFGCSKWKETQCSFTIWKDISGKKINKTVAKSLLKKGETKEEDGFKSRDGKPFKGKLVLQEGKVVVKISH
jgi:DNA topoisomerase-3